MRALGAILLGGGVWSGLAQSGALDPSFAIRLETPGEVYAVVTMKGGQLMVGGNFRTVGGVECFGLAKLNPDGSVDKSFKPSIQGVVQSMALQSDGAILVGGNLSWRDQEGYPSVVRLHPDGSPDASFIRDCVVEYSDVRSLVVCADGRILVGGGFGYVGRNLPWPQGAHFLDCVARLNLDGTVDTEFDPGTAAETPYSVVDALAVSPSGKIYVAGDFTTFNGLPKPFLVRLHPDGSVDMGFELDARLNHPVNSVIVQPDGKALAAGSLAGGYAGTGFLARLETEGAIDLTFRSDLVLEAFDLVLEEAGTVVIAGSDQMDTIEVMRLDSNGQLLQRLAGPIRNSVVDQTEVHTLVKGPDQSFILGGAFDQVGQTECVSLATISSQGGLDAPCQPPVWRAGLVHAIVSQADGGILVGGGFNRVDGEFRGGVARLTHQGTLDPSFAPSQTLARRTIAMVEQADGSVLVGGLPWFDGVRPSALMRLLPNGVLDTGYAGDVDDVVYALEALPDGRVLVGGTFRHVNGQEYAGLTRLDVNGQLDPGFSLGTNAYRVWTIGTQTDGKILIGGRWPATDGVNQQSLARLHEDGAPDEAFQVEADLDSVVAALAVDADARILVGGNFQDPDGEGPSGLLRLTSDGKVDRDFHSALGPHPIVRAIHILADGRILVAGQRFPIGVNRQGVALLRDDGSIDPGFERPFPSSVYSETWAAALASDEEALLSCSSSDVTTGYRLARIFVSGDSSIRLASPRLDEPDRMDLDALVRGPLPPAVVLEQSSDLIGWDPLSTNIVTDNPLPIGGIDRRRVPTFLRARIP